MIIATQQTEREVFDKIHAVVEGNTGNIFIGDTHLAMNKRTFERLVFTMQTALMEYDLHELNKNAEY
jgi:hypothetical protein